MEAGSIERIYTNPRLLEEAGPLVEGTWAIPAKSLPRSPHLRASVPAPISGLLAIDTGSNRTWMAQNVLADLDLQPFSEETAHGSSGVHRVPLYLAELVVPFGNEHGPEDAMTSVLSVAAVPGLNEVMPLTGGDGPLRLVGLLGRDFLRHVTFTYDGPTGKFQLRIDGSDLRVRAA